MALTLTGTTLKCLMYLLCSQQVLSGSVDWCALSCPGNEKNTMCKYSPTKYAGNCKNIEMATTNVVRKEFLDLHNSYRDKIAGGQIEEKGQKWPVAGDMRQMSWDNDLEKLAYRWAQQCSDNPPHDKCRRTPMFEYNGQNCGFNGNTAAYPSPNGTFHAWVGEISDTTPAIVDTFQGGSWSHFSQVIWAGTYKLGCSVVHAEKRGFMSTITVCNYGPGGNMLGAKVYTKGQAACDKCPSGTQCNNGSAYINLCALPSDAPTPQDIDAPSDINNESSQLRIFGMEPKCSQLITASFSALLTSIAIKMHK